ncbi:MAG: aminotransferase class V-fold PLP-dependent enzyme [Phycisphaerales bacterium]|nr:aminotransferase class V-fold PLP-dependent enzyme [Phycisphaerales bacterium]
MSSGKDSAWSLDPGVYFLNHGSFGACPVAVQAHQQLLRERMEREPVRFMVEELPGLIEASRSALASFLGADADGVVFVGNATQGVNTVLASFPFAGGDEIVTTDHEYNACRCALEHYAGRAGAKIVVAPVPFPIRDPSEVTEAVLGAVTARTRLAMISHITSPSALIFPIGEIVRGLRERGAMTLVDGAHAPGMVSLDLNAIDADYYTGNCHKWMCAPKGAAFLHVREDRREALMPMSISHGYNAPDDGRPVLHRLFDWTGTSDPTAVLSIPSAIETVGAMAADGWEGVMRANHELALRARDILCGALACDPPAPDEMLGSMAAMPIPDAPGMTPSGRPYHDALQVEILRRHGVQAPVSYFPRAPKRVIRVSAQRYNTVEQYQRLASALVEELARERRG